MIQYACLGLPYHREHNRPALEWGGFIIYSNIVYMDDKRSYRGHQGKF